MIAVDISYQASSFTNRNDRPIDPSGVLRLGAEEAPFANAVELLELIAQSDQGQACFAENWVNFAFGTHIPVATSSRLATAFKDNELRIRELLVLVTQQDAFYFRRAEASQ